MYIFPVGQSVGRAGRGGRWADVPPERLERWLDGFDARHRIERSAHDGQVARFWAADGAVAECHVPFAPMAGPETGVHPVRESLVAHVLRERTVGVVLARLGGHAAGVFEGERLVAWKASRRLVHGRHSAGGRSQKRFARRREGQARVAVQAAADAAAGVLLPALPALDAVVLGGDRRALRAVCDDPRLAPVAALAGERFLPVPTPTLAVLLATPRQFRAVRIRVLEAWQFP
jgi:hypothetical protein